MLGTRAKYAGLSRMKVCHAAALTIAVWYLMFPPIDPASGFDPTVTRQQPDLKAQLDQWWIADTFETFDLCRAAIASMTPKPTSSSSVF
jgi:hypothetical protein